MAIKGAKRQVALLASSNLVLQLMGFVYRMQLTKYAGAEALGLNSLIMQIYSLVVSVCISGLSVSVTACAARLTGGGAAEQDTPQRNINSLGSRMHGLIKKAVAVYCGLWLLAALPIFFLRERIAINALGSPGAGTTLAVMLVCIFMTGLENVLKAAHMGSGLVGRCAASELCEQAVRFALVILMLINLPHEGRVRTSFFIMLGMTASEIVSVSFLSCSFIASFGIRSANNAKSTAIAANNNGATYSEILKTALPASATAMASTVFSAAAALLLPGRLQAFGMLEQQALSLIGIMSTVAAPITLFPMAAVAALSSVLMPRIAARYSRGEGVKPTAFKALRVTALFGLAATLLIIPAAPAISQRLFGTEAHIALFAALGVKAVVIYLQVVSVAVLNGAKKQGIVLVYAIGGELFQLVLMLLLTPVLGIYGYIAAMILGELLRLLCNIDAISALPK